MPLSYEGWWGVESCKTPNGLYLAPGKVLTTPWPLLSYEWTWGELHSRLDPS